MIEWFNFQKSHDCWINRRSMKSEKPVMVQKSAGGDHNQVENEILIANLQEIEPSPLKP